jgi:pSer/pThr/pTyr-binding forkhead associated (FHA) protein
MSAQPHRPAASISPGAVTAPPPFAAPRKPAPSGPIAPPRNATATGSFPPPLPGGPSAQRGGMPSLFVIFNGQKFPVNKEEFVIGRGSKTADLPIKDGNISRRHAAIVLQNGAFYMKDLGSTNGIEFNGVRVDSRRIEEGDIYQLCDYELRFTYL